MALVCTSSDRWFQAYTSEQYTDYLRIKALSEYGLGKYEQLYINQDDEPSQRKIQQTIAKGKVFPDLPMNSGLQHLIILRLSDTS